MPKLYKTELISVQGFRVKGDDTSNQLACLIDQKCNKMSNLGWELFSITPSLTSEGALLKLLLTFVQFK